MVTTSRLIALADDLRVGALAQPSYCADPSRPLAEVLERAVRDGFDFLPVRFASRPVTHLITRAALEGLSDWGNLAEVIAPVTAEMLVSTDAPALSVLDRLGPRSVLFTLGSAGVEGVITIYDLNEPTAHLLGFGLVLVCEEALAVWLRGYLGSNLDVAAARVRDLKAAGSGFARWVKQRMADQHGDLAAALTLGEKIRAIEGAGPALLAEHYGIEPADLIPRLNRLRELRNAIGHYDEGALRDPGWVHTRLLETRDLARRLAA